MNLTIASKMESFTILMYFFGSPLIDIYIATESPGQLSKIKASDRNIPL